MPAGDDETPGERRYEIYGRMMPVGEATEPIAGGDAEEESTAGVMTLDRIDVKVSSAADGEPSVVWPVTIEPGSLLRFGVAPAEIGEGWAGTVSVAFRDVRGGEVELASRMESWSPGRFTPLWKEISLDDVSGEGELIFQASGSSGEGASVRWLNPMLLRRAREARPNVVIVCIDTLRADRSMGETAAEVMPNLTRRTSTGTTFERAYANSSWSLPSMATILTGLYPGQHNAGRRALVGESEDAVDYNARVAEGGIELTLDHKVYRYQMLHPAVPTLQEALGGGGYLTGAIHNNGYISYPTRVLKDFDYVEHYEQRDAAVGTARALDWLDTNRDSRFFLFLHYIDPHQWPRRIPEELRGKGLAELDESGRETILATYDELVRYTDLHVEEFLVGLEERGLADDTIFVLLADHGERFFERGVTGSHGGGFMETVIRVPLAYWGAGIPAKTVAERVHLVDVVPTLLDLAGRSHPARFQGRSAADMMRGEREIRPGREVVSEFVLWGPEQVALLDRDWKYVYRPEAERGELYDLSTDPGELDDLSTERSEIAARLHERLIGYLRSSADRFAALEYGETVADDKMLDSLRALGYID